MLDLPVCFDIEIHYGSLTGLDPLTSHFQITGFTDVCHQS